MSGKRRAYSIVMKLLMWLSVGLTGALVLFLVGFIFAKGLPNITWELLTESPSYLQNKIGILPDIVNTVYLVLATLIIVLPLGVGAAVYLTEYAHNGRIVSMIEYPRSSSARWRTESMRSSADTAGFMRQRKSD